MPKDQSVVDSHDPRLASDKEPYVYNAIVIEIMVDEGVLDKVRELRE
jgi:hypothetical protein